MHRYAQTEDAQNTNQTTYAIKKILCSKQTDQGIQYELK